MTHDPTNPFQPRDLKEQIARQNTGNHPDPLSEMLLISAQDLEDLVTFSANASSAAGASNTYREKEAWGSFDAIVNRVKSIPLSPRRDVTIDLAASLAAAISLLERGGKKAAPSDKMFDQMLDDYRGALARFRAAEAAK